MSSFTSCPKSLSLETIPTRSRGLANRRASVPMTSSASVLGSAMTWKPNASHNGRNSPHC